MADPGSSLQLLRGFHSIEGNAWRWTARTFALTLRPPVGGATNGGTLVAKFSIPDTVISRVHRMTLSAKVNGTELPSETYTKAGEIALEGRDVARESAEHIVALGCSHVPEGRQVFASMSVQENLLMGAHVQFRRGRKDEVKADLERIFRLFPVLGERQRQFAGTLSGGEQQMLAMGRALMARPSLLMLDEPSMGLAPLIVEQIFEIVRGINADGVSVLLVEQNARQALQLADRGYVLETGKVILEGKAAELLENKDVQRAYLGRDKKEIWER